MVSRRAARTRLLPGVALAGTLLAAGAAHAAPPVAASVTHTVTIEAMRFTPQSLSLSPGDRVVWVNRDPFPHTVVSDDGRFRSPEIAPGQSWRHAFGRRGRLAYGCSLHPTMRAELLVR